MYSKGLAASVGRGTPVFFKFLSCNPEAGNKEGGSFYSARGVNDDGFLLTFLTTFG